MTFRFAKPKDFAVISYKAYSMSWIDRTATKVTLFYSHCAQSTYYYNAFKRKSSFFVLSVLQMIDEATNHNQHSSDSILQFYLLAAAKDTNNGLSVGLGNTFQLILLLDGIAV